MKHEKPDSLLHRMGDLFARNFGLKLLSLALAILIYEVLKPEAKPYAQPLFQPQPSRVDPPGGHQTAAPERPKADRSAPRPQTAAAPSPTAAQPPAENKAGAVTKPADDKTNNTTTRTNSKSNGKSRK